MGSVLNLISDWLDSEEKEAYFLTHRPLVLRWFNEAQARYADESQILRSTWSPTVPSNGVIALPSDFLREFSDRVMRSATDKTVMRKMNYQEAQFTDFSDVRAYSIFAGNLYVWTATSCSPIIPYIKLPTAVTLATLDTATLEITPPKYAHSLIWYFDAMFARSKGDMASYMAMLEKFTSTSRQDGIEFLEQNDQVYSMRSGRLV
jgi:hypothetical protein